MYNNQQFQNGKYYSLIKNKYSFYNNESGEENELHSLEKS